MKQWKIIETLMASIRLKYGKKRARQILIKDRGHNEKKG